MHMIVEKHSCSNVIEQNIIFISRPTARTHTTVSRLGIQHSITINDYLEKFKSKRSIVVAKIII